LVLPRLKPVKFRSKCWHSQHFRRTNLCSPLAPPTQSQTAVRACVQQLSALGPHLERGELSFVEVRRECLNHIVVFGEAHLRRILRSYACYYNDIRRHRSLDKDAPVSLPIQRTGIISSRPILADFIITTSAFRFSVHTPGPRASYKNSSLRKPSKQKLLRSLTSALFALIDEATGYQDDRAKYALAKIFTSFLAKERQKWTLTFPLDFYKEIYRLRGWKFEPWNTKRPSVVASWTDDFVYDRLAPGLTDELRNKNLIAETGRRSGKHHQWFNPDKGHPKLKEHISGVIALLRAADNWEAFRRGLDRAYPKFGEPFVTQDSGKTT
jgi:hypothetical protein